MKKKDMKAPLSLALYDSCEPEDLAVPQGALAAVEAAVLAALSYEGVCGPCEVSLTLCDGEYIRALNAEYRGKDTATDVLSFPLFDPPVSQRSCRGHASHLGERAVQTSRPNMTRRWQRSLCSAGSTILTSVFSTRVGSFSLVG